MTETISYEKFSIVIDAEFFGTVKSFHADGIEILRSTLPYASDARNSAAFAMFPFVGRIDNGEFSWRDEVGSYIHHKLPANMPPEPHAIHGHAWQKPWLIQHQNDKSLTLSYEHHQGEEDWPWAYKAVQRFALTKLGLQVELGIQNNGNSPMPAGMGWHPYFANYTRSAKLLAHLDKAWLKNEKKPVNQVSPLDKFGLSMKFPYEGETLDCAFSLPLNRDVKKQIANIIHPKYVAYLIADSSIQHMVIYAPENEDFFCIEPVTQTPNAVNFQEAELPATCKQSGLKILQPKQSMTSTIHLCVD